MGKVPSKSSREAATAEIWVAGYLISVSEPVLDEVEILRSVLYLSFVRDEPSRTQQRRLTHYHVLTKTAKSRTIPQKRDRGKP
jgi:hypothetical protein